MAWLGKVSLGGFPDLAGAVTKFSESVKNIEKNFDSALGLEEKGEGGSGGGEVSGIWSSGSDGKGLLSFMGNKGDDGKAVESLENVDSTENSLAEAKISELPPSVSGNEASLGGANQMPDKEVEESILQEVSGNEASLEDSSSTPNIEVHKFNSHTPETTSDTADETQKDIAEGLHVESAPLADTNFQVKDPEHTVHEKEDGESHSTSEASVPDSMDMVSDAVGQMESCETTVADDSQNSLDNKQQTSDSQDQENGETETMESVEKGSLEHVNIQGEDQQSHVETGTPDSSSSGFSKDRSSIDLSNDQVSDSLSTMEVPVKFPGPDNQQAEVNSQTQYTESDGKEHSSGAHVPQTLDAGTDLEKVKKEMKMMEAALQGAARQAQAKADEIAKLLNENEQLKSTVEDLQKKTLEAENDALREEYHQRVSALERKVYALTRERDTLRREQNKKSDVAILLKEKDEIISQVMAEGENLSKKQAAQESTIRKLRAQIREFDEEKQRLNSKLQVEEAKVESMKRDKAATEKLLQDTIEKNQSELAAQKEFYTNALNAAKEAEALAEARANNEAKIELENRLREASERESMLVQTLDELRQTLSRTERQAVFREDMLQKDIDELQKRYQASELRYNELITQVPESTRPLLRQIEAMQESAARKAEAWAGVENNLNSRLEAAEAKAAASEEKERLMNERLSQTLSRMTVLETQIACLRTEQTQLSRSLEKERQRAAESRQEYLVAMEEVATHEGRAKQLEDELRELRAKHKHDLQEALVQELLEKELEREKATRLELENSAHLESSYTSQDLIAKHMRSSENGSVPSRRLSSAGSQSSMEESYFLQASLDSSENTYSDRRTAGEISPYYLKSMTPSAFEAALRHKDGELASYISRVASLEAIRDSLAEELVKMTAQCEKLQAEAALLPGVRAELEALRRRHSSALELMGERDEELEELRADIIDLKEMYREQVDLLVNKIQTMGGST